ncbi:MAG: NAD(P)H-quinone oxidoreductase [Candidatus Nanopelagicales bacterium]|jgi:putative PIG3 family NAD(P)H quinone oxidoreductase|nr:NAD(P)H-quinone oxidoreductase [Candidatus Nanopelagicales bacterium]
MYAIVQSRDGGPEVLEWQKVPDPTPKPGEVIIEVAASAVNRADLLQREGNYPPPSGSSEILGLECSGAIAAVGAALTLDRIGEKVTALLAGGGYATKVAVPVGQLMSVPEGVSLIDAAGLPEAACTVWANLSKVARIKEGETLLIHGGGSGIGTMAIQIAHALGVRVAVTAGSQAKLNACSALGAEILINYNDEDFVEAIKDQTAGRGADVILDNMGASYLMRNVDALNRNGRIVTIGMQGGTKAEFDIAALLRKNGTFAATSMRARPDTEKAAICREVEKVVWPWIESGVVKPVIDRVMPMQDAADAHRLLQDGPVTGKIVLQAP